MTQCRFITGCQVLFKFYF